MLWILPSEKMKSTFGQYGRFLRREEKARLCGIEPASLTSLSQADLETALGNCIPVHMMAAVLYPVFRAFAIFAANPLGEGEHNSEGEVDTTQADSSQVDGTQDDFTQEESQAWWDSQVL